MYAAVFPGFHGCLYRAGVRPGGYAFEKHWESSVGRELDLETWSYLSQYFADKLRAGVALHTYRFAGEVKRKKEAIRLLRKCLQHWRKVSDLTSSHYKSVPYIDDLGYGKAYRDAKTFSWDKYLSEVERDIAIARKSVFTP